MNVSDFDYELPSHLIAQEPLAERDASRLLVVDRRTGSWEHRRFLDLPDLLQPGDVAVVNDTKVIPARLRGRKETGGNAEVLLVRPLDNNRWLAMTRPGLRPGQRVRFGAYGGATLTAEAVAVCADGLREVALAAPGSLQEALQALGELPTPPYVRGRLAQPGRYQTIYARQDGSIAAPTAGLHFTPRVFDALSKRGIAVERLTLHVGLGTFRPVKTNQVEAHTMHSERYILAVDVAERLNAAHGAGRRIIAIGTTVTRALESAAGANGELRAGDTDTSLFIRPGYDFRIVKGLLTNFHLPRSTLLMLVSAFAGRDRVLAAYQEAVGQAYRFYSFGDAMLVV